MLGSIIRQSIVTARESDSVFLCSTVATMVLVPAALPISLSIALRKTRYVNHKSDRYTAQLDPIPNTNRFTSYYLP